MTGDGLGLAAAFSLGLLTATSPCPLATNLAAIAFLGRRVDRPGAAVLAGLVYALAQAVTFAVLAALLVSGLLQAAGLAAVLERDLPRFLGPLLMLVGLVLLGGLAGGPVGRGLAARLQPLAARLGLPGAALLGVAFALSFCPVTAALFFGSLLPLAARLHSVAAVPAAFGLGACLPVLALALLMAHGLHALGLAFRRLAAVHAWTCRAAGLLLTLRHVYHLPV